MVTVSVIETEDYRERSSKLLTVDERAGIRSFLAESPDAGDIIPGLDGLRKLRWTQRNRNKGKRGGSRVIYFYAALNSLIVLLAVYSKGEKEDLSHADRKELKTGIAEIKVEFAKKRNNQARQKPPKRS